MRALKGRATLIQAFTVEDGHRLFMEQPDITAVVMDGEVSNNGMTTFHLTLAIREHGFKGHIIAASSDPRSQHLLMECGCSHKAPAKSDVPVIVRQLLSLS